MILELILMGVSGICCISVFMFILYDIVTDIFQSTIVNNVCRVVFILTYSIIIYNFVMMLAHEYERVELHKIVNSVEKIERVKILSMTKPNHVYISVLSLETNDVTKNIYVSKFCDHQNLNDIGTEINIPVKYVTYRNGTTDVLYNASTVCK